MSANAARFHARLSAKSRLAGLGVRDAEISKGRQVLILVVATVNPERSANFRLVDFDLSVLQDFERDGRKGLRIAWKTMGDPWYLKAERVQELQETADGGCEYRNCETFCGPLSAAVKWFVGSALEKNLALWRDGLKAAAESSTQAGDAAE